jgi:hypothetical protein
VVEFNLNGLPDNTVHISGFHGEDGSIVELNAMTLVDTVFSYGPQERQSVVLRHSVTSQKVAGSRPDNVIEIYQFT